MHPIPRLRPMREHDIPAVLAVQSACYTELVPESADAFLTKLAASPGTCWVALGVRDRLLGYLVALPWRFDAPPALDLRDCRLPAEPDCLYLHDLAIAPHARGQGVADALVDAFVMCLRDLRLPRAALTAVQGSAAFWARHGFSPVDDGLLPAAKLASYGAGACYMTRPAKRPAARIAA
ncbi:GNAT family N-acetyltransferase [Derxia gummosa]|uniref:GNAT family N-acetyltransferase n=1 Tax=Derxia gummosa DSM 723 TaxID=1121388 RepID=A0A8B6XBD9_9BURK|nr:GNAT family N-acetyltransferase [Derxia gummosa]